MRKQDPALRLAREICQKLVEKRLLGSSQAGEALEWLGLGLRPMFEEKEAMPVMDWARELALRLIEQDKARTPQAVFEILSDMRPRLKEAALSLPSEKAAQAMWAAADLALKLLEVNFISQAQLIPTIENLASSAAKVLP
jgi:hypothetical protein